MKIEIQIDSAIQEDKLVIYTKQITDEIQKLIKKLENECIEVITGVYEEKIYILKPDDINYFYAEEQKILAKTTDKVIQVKLKLYEIENILEEKGFLRISNSVIANINKIDNIEMSFNGVMCIRFKNGDKEYSSRRYVKKIKESLAL
ncbi:MAG: LytTR family DNA-binding domain-containing protein [Cellulosilyticaceae bacterium]